jgi:hypothetical protein
MTRYLPLVLAVLVGLALGLRTRPSPNDPPATPAAASPTAPPAALSSPAECATTEPSPPRATPAAAPPPGPEPIMVGPDGVIYRRVPPRP